MSSRPDLYSIYGYDKDDDVYELVGYEYENLEMAIMAAKSIAVSTPIRDDNGQPFDWIEVVHEDSGVRQYVLPCI